MNMLLIAMVIVGWLACGMLGAGVQNAYFRGKYHDLITVGAFGGLISEREATITAKKDQTEAIIQGLLTGPIGLVVSLFLCRFGSYGISWEYKPIRPEQ